MMCDETIVVFADGPTRAFEERRQAMAGSTEDFDLVVIGFGKAGKTVAMKRAKAGDRVALVERDPMMYGGTCINVGCVPTKTLLTDMARFELGGGDGAKAFKRAQQRRNALVRKMNAANLQMAEAAGVQVILGEGRFVGERTIAVRTEAKERVVEGTVVVIDTGSETIIPPVPGADLPRVYTSTSIQQIERLPRRLVIVGGGPIALEFSTLFSGFGTEVHIVDNSDRALRNFEPDVAAYAQGVLERRNINFHLNNTATLFEKEADGIRVRLADGNVLEADAVLCAIGRKPATSTLDLGAAGIEVTPRGAVKVDEHLRTNVDGVYAAGDVNGGPQFTYVSFDDHRIIIEDAWGADKGHAGARSTCGRVLPTTTFIEPPLATVGMSEAAAVVKGYDVVVRSGLIADMAIVPRPKILGQTDGMAKFVIDAKSDLILGATLFCPDAQELINAVAVAIRSGMTATELGGGIYTHPSTSELFNALLG